MQGHSSQLGRFRTYINTMAPITRGMPNEWLPLPELCQMMQDLKGRLRVNCLRKKNSPERLKTPVFLLKDEHDVQIPIVPLQYIYTTFYHKGHNAFSKCSLSVS